MVSPYSASVQCNMCQDLIVTMKAPILRNLKIQLSVRSSAPRREPTATSQRPRTEAKRVEVEFLPLAFVQPTSLPHCLDVCAGVPKRFFLPV